MPDATKPAINVPIIDLKLVRKGSGGTLSCLIWENPEEKPAVLGPIPLRDSAKKFGDSLYMLYPDLFRDRNHAREIVIRIHARNMLYGRNLAGTEYPQVVR